MRLCHIRRRKLDKQQKEAVNEQSHTVAVEGGATPQDFELPSTSTRSARLQTQEMDVSESLEVCTASVTNTQSSSGSNQIANLEVDTPTAIQPGNTLLHDDFSDTRPVSLRVKSDATILSDGSGDITTPEVSMYADTLKKRKCATLQPSVVRPATAKTTSGSMVSNRHKATAKLKGAKSLKPELNYFDYAMSLVPQVIKFQKSASHTLFKDMVMYLLVDEHLKGGEMPLKKLSKGKLDFVGVPLFPSRN